MKYKNPYYKKMKNSFLMLVTCAFCKEKIALYQKVGKGGLLRMHIERIIESSVDLTSEDKGLRCPNCNKLLASRSFLKRENNFAYNMIRGRYNTSIL